MPLGPIEIVTIGFPGNHFNGSIVPEIQRLVDADAVTIVDGLFVTKDSDGVTTFAELGKVVAHEDIAALVAAMDRVDGLISDEDVQALTTALEPDTSAVVLAFEHTWLKPLSDAVVESGGVLLDSVRIPGSVVEEILVSVPDENQT